MSICTSGLSVEIHQKYYIPNAPWWLKKAMQIALLVKWIYVDIRISRQDDYCRILKTFYNLYRQNWPFCRMRLQIELCIYQIYQLIHFQADKNLDSVDYASALRFQKSQDLATKSQDWRKAL